MILSRRFFLIGSAAAIAVAKLPVIPNERITVTPLPAMATFKQRRICDLAAGFWDTGGQPTQFELFVRGQSFFNVGLGDGTTLRWVATPGNELILMPGETVVLSIKPERLKGGVQLVVADTVDEGPPIHRAEIHQYPFKVPVLNDLDVDNSLKARLERKRAAEEWAALHPERDWEPEDEDDV